MSSTSSSSTSTSTKTITTTSSPNTKESPETAQWTKYLPEAFGIRENVRNTPYRWCVRESSLWGIATGTVMSLHRLRMNSSVRFAINVGFTTTFLVSIPTYYFCVKKRDYKERLIEIMMRANDFQEAKEMPPQTPAGEEHPFLDESKHPSASSNTNWSSSDSDSDPHATYSDSNLSSSGRSRALLDREFVAHLPERKDWQTPIPQQDAKDVFSEKKL